MHKEIPFTVASIVDAGGFTCAKHGFDPASTACGSCIREKATIHAGDKVVFYTANTKRKIRRTGVVKDVALGYYGDGTINTTYVAHKVLILGDDGKEYSSHYTESPCTRRFCAFRQTWKCKCEKGFITEGKPPALVITRVCPRCGPPRMDVENLVKELVSLGYRIVLPKEKK